jgi:hypothetical protein
LLSNDSSYTGPSPGLEWGTQAVYNLTGVRNQGPRDEAKHGQYTAGFFDDNNPFATLPNGNSKSNGNSGVFVLEQQMEYRPDGPGTSQGLTIWGAWAYSSKELVSSMPVFGGAVSSYQGLIKKRKRDTVNAGWIYGRFPMNSSRSQRLASARSFWF